MARSAAINSSWWTPDRQAYAVNYLMQNAGLSDVGARGLVSRWMNVEAPGGPDSVNPTSGAQGIGQWLGDRTGGYQLGDFNSQLAHAVQELNGSERAAGDALRAATTDAQAATGASMFERAAGYNPTTGNDNFTAMTRAGIAGVAAAPSQVASYSRGYTSDPSLFNLSPAVLRSLSPNPPNYPDALTALASMGQGNIPVHPPGAVSLDPAVSQALGFAPTGVGVQGVAGGGGSPSLSSAAITANIQPYSTQAPYVPPAMGFNDPNNFGPNMRTLENAAFNSVTGPADVPTAFQAAQAADPIFAGSRHDPVSGWVTPGQAPAASQYTYVPHPQAPGSLAQPAWATGGPQTSIGFSANPAFHAPGFDDRAAFQAVQPSFPDPGAGTFAGGYGSYTPPSAGASPAMGAAAASGLQGYSGLSPEQLPLSQPPGDPAAPYAGSAYGPPAAAAAPPLQAAQAPGGVISNLIHTVISSPIGQHIATALSNPGSLSGITGFGGGPLPGGVSNQAGFSNWLGGQTWEGPGTGRGASFDPISGGSHYQYFAPSTPGGIGGYVDNGKVFTYQTDDTQNFFHEAGN